MAGVVRDFLVGSYMRKTAIRPLNDIDVFLELDRVTHRDRWNREPLLLLEDLQRALRACYGQPGPKTRIQGRSVNIDFAGTGIGFDVIPAFAESPGVYLVPDRHQRTWIRSNPEIHRERLVEANARAGGALNPLVKAAKHWNCRRVDAKDEKPLRSFHLEVMAYEAFSSKPPDLRSGVARLFTFLSQRVLSPCAEPARLGPNLDADLTPGERQRAYVELSEAARVANAAVASELGNPTLAHQYWQQLIGPEYKPRREPSSRSSCSSISHSTTRSTTA
jgi:hypothetical protein